MIRRRVYQSPHNVNLWKTPLILSVCAVGLFCLTYQIDLLDHKGVIHLPLWLHFGGIDDCRALLGSLMGATSTVLALIFSVSLLVLSMVATLFGPRLLYRFVQDPTTQTTIGLFMATFIFILLAFLVEQQEGTILFVPQLTVMCSWLLVLISFASLVYYSHRIAISIQNPDMIARIVDDFDAAVVANGMASRGIAAVPLEQGLVQKQLSEGACFRCKHSGYFQQVDHQRLVAAAAQADAVVHLLFRPGQFIMADEGMACVWPAAALPRLESDLSRSVHVGRHRVLKQDTEFGIYQIVEIAIRALSPAINDTFTGVACVDWLGDALIAVLSVPACDGSWYDAKGQLRLRQPEISFCRLLRAAFDQIRQALTDNPAVMIRMLSQLGRLAPRVHGESERDTLRDQAAAIWEEAQSGSLVRLDRSDVEAAWIKANQALGSVHQ